MKEEHVTKNDSADVKKSWLGSDVAPKIHHTVNCIQLMTHISNKNKTVKSHLLNERPYLPSLVASGQSELQTYDQRMTVHVE